MIKLVEKGSIADEMGVEPGDILVSINGKQIKDVFDYRYLVKDEYLEVLIQKPDGEQWELEIEKDEDDELGLVFDTGLMDTANTCKNKCIFCFIDQLPRGMRESLYFKDDDARLGFLQGNYVTLTNIDDSELDRIIYYHLSPINISVHTVDPDLRMFMLKNPKSKRLLSQLDRLYSAGIEMNFQIVLCKNINDAQNLDESINVLSNYIPKARSLSVVPVGLSKHRDGLYNIEPFDSLDAANIVRQIESWQHRLKTEKSTAFVFAADEFYLLAGMDIPKAHEYEDFPQIENGVGMLALFKDEFGRELEKYEIARSQSLTVVTGFAAYRFMQKLTQKLMHKFPALNIYTVPVENIYLGKSITVSGLLTGRDILAHLKDTELGERVLIPKNALRANDSVFLDDMDIRDLSDSLGVPVECVETTGYGFLRSILI